MSSKKGRSAARQAAKNYRRAVRKSKSKPDPRKWRNPPDRVPKWMRGKPMMKFGIGGTDKSHRGGRATGRSSVYYSDKRASE